MSPFVVLTLGLYHGSMEDKLLEGIIRKMLQAIADNKRGLDALANALVHYTTYLHTLMRRCDSAGCDRVATVHNDVLDFYACDGCAARMVVRGISGIKAMKDVDRDPDLDPMREAAANEKLWRDLPEAEAVRMIERHYDLIGCPGQARVTQ